MEWWPSESRIGPQLPESAYITCKSGGYLPVSEWWPTGSSDGKSDHHEPLWASPATNITVVSSTPFILPPFSPLSSDHRRIFRCLAGHWVLRVHEPSTSLRPHLLGRSPLSWRRAGPERVSPSHHGSPRLLSLRGCRGLLYQ